MVAAPDEEEKSWASMVSCSRGTASLWVFDLDGTLLVSHGREIIEVAGMRAGIHPLIEAHVSCALPRERRSDYRYCGEEDAHGDPHGLIMTAAVIEPVASKLRAVMGQSDAEAAILTARAHDPTWLSEELAAKLQLARPIRPDLIQCVYSNDFEENVCRGSTAERKAAALDILVRRAGTPRTIHFFDDVKTNLECVERHFADPAKPDLRAHLVDFQHSLDALSAAKIDPADVFHPQCRDERKDEPNDLVKAIQGSLSASKLAVLKKLSMKKPPAATPLPAASRVPP
mmetsp:Transcript_6245/g.18924  ORF Transcript_6245/g.18924 Transcript_6245/m.18924 type:complete len:286 (-) Transcript_6245:147-1004(-)